MIARAGRGRTVLLANSLSIRAGHGAARAGEGAGAERLCSSFFLVPAALSAAAAFTARARCQASELVRGTSVERFDGESVGEGGRVPGKGWMLRSLLAPGANTRLVAEHWRWRSLVYRVGADGRSVSAMCTPEDGGGGVVTFTVQPAPSGAPPTNEAAQAEASDLVRQEGPLRSEAKLGTASGAGTTWGTAAGRISAAVAERGGQSAQAAAPTESACCASAAGRVGDVSVHVVALVRGDSANEEAASRLLRRALSSLQGQEGAEATFAELFLWTCSQAAGVGASEDTAPAVRAQGVRRLAERALARVGSDDGGKVAPRAVAQLRTHHVVACATEGDFDAAVASQEAGVREARGTPLEHAPWQYYNLACALTQRGWSKRGRGAERDFKAAVAALDIALRLAREGYDDPGSRGALGRLFDSYEPPAGSEGGGEGLQPAPPAAPDLMPAGAPWEASGPEHWLLSVPRLRPPQLPDPRRDGSFGPLHGRPDFEALLAAREAPTV